MSSIPFSIPPTPLAIRYGKQAVQGKQNQALKVRILGFALAEVLIHPANAISNAVSSLLLILQYRDGPNFRLVADPPLEILQQAPKEQLPSVVSTSQ
jgi:hypothetical protein